MLYGSSFEDKLSTTNKGSGIFDMTDPGSCIDGCDYD